MFQLGSGMRRTHGICKGSCPEGSSVKWSKVESETGLGRETLESSAVRNKWAVVGIMLSDKGSGFQIGLWHNT